MILGKSRGFPWKKNARKNILPFLSILHIFRCWFLSSMNNCEAAKIPDNHSKNAQINTQFNNHCAASFCWQVIPFRITAFPFPDCPPQASYSAGIAAHLKQITKTPAHFCTGARIADKAKTPAHFCAGVWLAPPTGLEPVTPWLTVRCSTDWAMEECL